MISSSVITLHLLLLPLTSSKLACSLLQSLTSSKLACSLLQSLTSSLLSAISLLQLELARRLEKIAAEKGVQLFLASDVIVADKFAADANNKVHTHSLSQ
jgi:thiamine monophosphate synthase